MKVALSVSVIQKGKSGVASYVFGLLQGWAKLDQPPELHLYGLEDDYSLFTSWNHLITWHPVSETYRPAVANLLWHQLLFPSALRKLKPDVVHIPSYRRMIACAPCRQVVTIHDMAPFHIDKKYDPARMFYGRVVVPRLAQNADEIITVSQATADDVTRFCHISQPPHVIWNGIDHSRFQPAASASSSPFQNAAGQSPPYFFYLARLEHPGKNHTRLIEAFEIFHRDHPDNATCLVLGGADWHGAEVIHQRIETSTVREKIHRAGFISDNELSAWYQHAVAMVYPSLFEGFGLPPVEAMACACPVICSDRGSLREIAGPAAKIIDPMDARNISNTMSEITHLNPEQRLSYVKSGLQHAAQFSWNRCARETLEVYSRA